ncbi:MAG: hypothetical protein O3A00_01730 [Planctomycetota bacterium]|nr:hypothetical protein [Planctomycetota bacterium]
MPFDFEPIKDLLVCPKTHASLVLHGDQLVSCDPETRLAYPIRHGDIPILLVDDAVTVEPEAWSTAMRESGRDAESGQPLVG